MLILSAVGDWRSFPANMGVLHMAFPLEITSLGTLPPSGVLSSPFIPAGPQLPGNFISVHLQVLALELGSRFLSEPRRVVVVATSL